MILINSYLTQDEAVSFLLKHFGSFSKTKFNKLLATFPRFYIPVDIDFHLNQFGSEVVNPNMESSYFAFEEKKMPSYSWTCVNPTESFASSTDFVEAVELKVKSILNEKYADFLSELKDLNKLNYKAISEYEHSLLKVDVEDETKLLHLTTEVYCDYLDFMDNIKDKKPISDNELTLYSLIEFGHMISLFLHKKIFNTEYNKYRHDENMYHFYFLTQLKDLVVLIKNSLSDEYSPLLDIAYNYFNNQTKVISYAGSPYNSVMLEVLKNV